MAVPLALVLAFLLMDHSHQRNDEGFYLQQAQDSYLLLRDHGLFSGLFQSYLSRGWRPIIHPFLDAPLLFLSSGRTRPAVICFIVALYGFFLLSVSKLLRQYLEPLESMVALWFVGLYPVFLDRATTFNSELPLLAVFAAFLYYFSKCDFFAFRRPSIFSGIFLGLSICIRPVESVMIASLIGVPYLLYAKSAAKLRRLDLLWLLGAISAVSAPLLLELRLPPFPPGQELAYLGAAFLPCALFFAPSKWRPQKNFWIFVSLTLGISVFWYAPVMHGLYDWAVGSSFAQWAKMTGNRTGASKLTFLGNVANYTEWPLLAAMFFISLPGLKTLGRYKKQLYLIVPAIFVPVILGSFSYNGDPRYYLVGLLLAAMAASIMAMSPGQPARRVRLVVCGAIVLVMAVYRVSVLRGDWSLISRLQSYLRGPYPAGVVRHDAIEDLYADWSRKFPVAVQNGKNEICILQMRQFNELDWLADPWALSVMGAEQGQRWTFIRPWTGISPTTAGRLKSVEDQCDYVVVMPIEHQEAPVDHFMSDVGEIVLSSWKHHSLKNVDLTFKWSGPFRGSEHSGRYVIFQSVRPKTERSHG